jgi:hypothetical protein
VIQGRFSAISSEFFRRQARRIRPAVKIVCSNLHSRKSPRSLDQREPEAGRVRGAVSANRCLPAGGRSCLWPGNVTICRICCSVKTLFQLVSAVRRMPWLENVNILFSCILARPTVNCGAGGWRDSASSVLGLRRVSSRFKARSSSRLLTKPVSANRVPGAGMRTIVTWPPMNPHDLALPAERVQGGGSSGFAPSLAQICADSDCLLTLDHHAGPETSASRAYSMVTFITWIWPLSLYTWALSST